MHTATSVAVAPAAPSAREEKKEAPPIAPLLASASVDAGAKSASKCKTCHDLTNAKKAKIGPPLWDIVQADKAHTAGFSYSGPMKDAKGNWTYEDLNKFLFDPKGFVPGTKMVFLGVKSDKERADLIAFLRSLSDSPRPMP
jgi:cytochrome c